VTFAPIRVLLVKKNWTDPTALGYLKFRNDALHADWARLNAAVVGSCIAFVEQLVLQHLA
jgi:hypothetical protein